MTTKTKTPEQLRDQAEKLAQQAAAVQAEIDAHSLREYDREQEAQRAAAQQVIDTFDAAALDRAVDDAHERLREAVAESPVVQAQAAYIAAQYLRNHGHADLTTARGLLGLPTGSPRGAGTTDRDLQEMTETTVHREAQRQVDAYRAEQVR